MTAQKLQYYIENGNIAKDRCIQIAKAAEDAIMVYSKAQNMEELALAMRNCCGCDPDEAAFFRAAVEFVLQEKWGAKPKDSAVLTFGMDQHYAQISGMPERCNPAASIGQKSKSSGCLILFGFIGILPLGVCAARFILG